MMTGSGFDHCSTREKGKEVEEEAEEDGDGADDGERKIYLGGVGWGSSIG